MGRGASGEFICASSALEVHVHLQLGRVAWATDSRHAFVFSRHLQEHAQITREQFREVLEECRRKHLPLGETLVQWKLATLGQVREALRHQISCALSELARASGGQQVFLERTEGYKRYASELTFALSEFDDELNPGPESGVNGNASSQGLLRRIREAVSDVGWIELLEGESVVDQDPPGTSQRVLPPVLRLTLRDGAELVTLRSARGALVGVSLRGGRTLWCRVGVDSTFAAAVSALSAVAGFDAAALPTPRAGTRRRWTVGDAQSAEVRELDDFLGRAPELMAALIVLPIGGELIHGVGHQDIPFDWCKDLVRRRSPLFALERDVFSEPPVGDSADLERLGFCLRSVASAEAGFWCFGAELGSPEGASAWIFIKREASQGLGWAYLTALARRLDALPSWQAHAQ
ncbi:MAG TPA: hypothetical protein VHM25_05055 [Polyangiaceae bacterium]|nr:hypothetical protein [Polyangiaceae bacterium]